MFFHNFHACVDVVDHGTLSSWHSMNLFYSEILHMNCLAECCYYMDLQLDYFQYFGKYLDPDDSDGHQWLSEGMDWADMCCLLLLFQTRG